LAEDDGDALERYAYDPYGNVTVLDGGKKEIEPDTWVYFDADGEVTEWNEDTLGSDWANTILFAGYYRDSETALYHVRNRMYHAQLGFWLIRDPEAYVDGMSLYEYVRSTPGNSLDPYGLDRLQFEGTLENRKKARKHWDEAKRQAKGPKKKKMEEIDSGKGKTVRIKVVFGDPRVVVGSYERGIDIEDIEAFPDKGPATKASKMAHEVVEQHAKQQDDQPYRKTGKGVGLHGDAAHAEGVKAEEAVTGWERGSEGPLEKLPGGRYRKVIVYGRERDQAGKPENMRKDRGPEFRRVIYEIDAKGKLTVLEQSILPGPAKPGY
jgi:RHS repeat-associated protein